MKKFALCLLLIGVLAAAAAILSRDSSLNQLLKRCWSRYMLS